MPVRSVVVAGRQAWRKSYPDTGGRRFTLALLDTIARRLGLVPLRPPPHRGGRGAKATEARRLRELLAQGVPVPALLDEDADTITLADLGPSLATCLRAAAGDPARIDALTRHAIAAIAAAHGAGAYFGQPVPRNLTFDNADGIGFIDFEEDPLEVMPLEQAQARDWLLFAFGMARHYDDRPDALAALLHEAFQAEPGDVGADVHRVGERLHALERVLRRFGRSARALAHSIFALRTASG
jgi:tRNA A-37 threonylcarbamoyl transferase component Bud32